MVCVQCKMFPSAIYEANFFFNPTQPHCKSLFYTFLLDKSQSFIHFVCTSICLYVCVYKLQKVLLSLSLLNMQQLCAKLSKREFYYAIRIFRLNMLRKDMDKKSHKLNKNFVTLCDENMKLLPVSPSLH